MHSPGLGLYEIRLDRDVFHEAVEKMFQGHALADDYTREEVAKALKVWLDDSVELLIQLPEIHILGAAPFRFNAEAYGDELRRLAGIREVERQRRALAEDSKLGRSVINALQS